MKNPAIDPEGDGNAQEFLDNGDFVNDHDWDDGNFLGGHDSYQEKKRSPGQYEAERIHQQISRLCVRYVPDLVFLWL